jgi:hypothetical protein
MQGPPRTSPDELSLFADAGSPDLRKSEAAFVSDDEDAGDRVALFMRLLDTLAALDDCSSAGDDPGGADDLAYHISFGAGDRRPRSASIWHLTTRRREDELLVIVDRPRTDPCGVELRFENETQSLAFRIDGMVVDRVSLMDPERRIETHATRNGILEVVLA